MKSLDNKSLTIAQLASYRRLKLRKPDEAETQVLRDASTYGCLQGKERMDLVQQERYMYGELQGYRAGMKGRRAA